ncbi:AAA family ATPase [Flavobacterium sp. Fl-77]|uniref:AAA family ATPase n=1 Tax=Flavobacterium flavipigmentatum TaxID=2893884 RepID=A0AAJ2W199_9FLAO|nr:MULTISPECIES: AAA family ATPase [unclassified Flavobacterium]MDX6182122.1 AAA family ATPase [Flavobacterium sp. Fl-33]MDX6185965.1 AAA family ATPase [Flavobacterium sp. Fl-77]UFH39140.1 AAA family ATPase [Flavobacterium sp. F-70]
MKISKLHIDQFRHLENLDFDFTYPEDFHIEEKRGKPLDKICFIGQSATGKTGLLQLIYDHSINLLNLELINGQIFRLKDNLNKSEVTFLIESDVFHLKNNEVSFRNRIYRNDFNSGGGQVTSLISKKDKKDVFYFKANLVSDQNINFLSTNPIELIEKHSNQLNAIKQEFQHRDNLFLMEENYGLLFNDNVDTKIWLHLLVDYLNYRKNFTQKMSELIHNGFIHDVNKLSVEFNKWQKENPNRLESFAKEFNYILELLNLEVDLVNTEYSVPIKNKRIDEIIPFQDTSTGTKQLLLTSLPLYSLETKDSIILIDEPERSLYPNIQMEVMDYYKKLAPEAQFIVATHSPFIAASFEPEERFILYFDEEGKVAVRRGISPIGDDPNDMLKNDFDLEFLMNEKGIKAFERYRNLKKLLASANDDEEKDKLLEEILSLANAYKF